MKFALLALTITLTTTVFAQSVIVTSDVRAPFNCQNAFEDSRTALTIACTKLNMSLGQIAFSECQPDGDDGGYVNYFSMKAQGICLPRKI